jgi:Family of unknown function (DUF5701)
LVSAVTDQRQTRHRAEFDRQVETLVRLGYPQLMGMSQDAFVRHLTPLANMVTALPDGGGGRMPFILVPGEGLIPRVQAVGLTEMDSRAGFTSMEDDDLKRFTPVVGVDIPAGPYLLLDVDTGPATLDVVPDEALAMITDAGRSPITIDEGLAIITQFPGILQTRNCFSTLASRCGDRRVPALWVSNGRPRLGWCWAAAPHSWLGSASCADRAG